jgi:hypothetical protein
MIRGDFLSTLHSGATGYNTGGNSWTVAKI